LLWAGLIQSFLHTDAFTHRSVYTQMFLHAENFTHGSTYGAQIFFTQKCFYMEESKFLHTFFLHREVFIQGKFYTQTRLHTEVFTSKNCYTQKFLHRFLTHRGVYTGKFLHWETDRLCGIAKITSFLTSDHHFGRKGCIWHVKIAVLTFDHHFMPEGCIWRWKATIFSYFLPFGPHSFHAKRLNLTLKNRNFVSVFDIRPSFHVNGLQLTFQNCNFLPVLWHLRLTVQSHFYISFCRLTFVLCERVASEVLKLQFYNSFWRSTSFRAKRSIHA
jgi:hypothetical protein